MPDRQDHGPLLAAEEQRRTAIMANDADTLDRLLTDDFVYIHSNGLVEGRDGYLGRIRSGATRYVDLQVKSFTVRRYPGTAIADGEVFFTYELANGSGGAVKAHFLAAWVETADGWRLGGYGSTMLT
jgi:hypothetical protein